MALGCYSLFAHRSSCLIPACISAFSPLSSSLRVCMHDKGEGLILVQQALHQKSPVSSSKVVTFPFKKRGPLTGFVPFQSNLRCRYG